MECLIDYIGIRGCGETPPASGLYINTLPGLSLESIDKIADQDQITYKGVWANAQIEAATRFYIDFIDELGRCFKLSPYCDYEQLICNNRTRLVNAWRYLLGNQIMIMREFSPRINFFTTVKLDDVEPLKNFYQVEYEQALKQAVKLIDVSTCELCCGGNPEVVTWLP